MVDSRAPGCQPHRGTAAVARPAHRWTQGGSSARSEGPAPAAPPAAAASHLRRQTGTGGCPPARPAAPGGGHTRGAAVKQCSGHAGTGGQRAGSNTAAGATAGPQRQPCTHPGRTEWPPRGLGSSSPSAALHCTAVHAPAAVSSIRTGSSVGTPSWPLPCFCRRADSGWAALDEGVHSGGARAVQRSAATHTALASSRTPSGSPNP